MYARTNEFENVGSFITDEENQLAKRYSVYQVRTPMTSRLPYIDYTEMDRYFDLKESRSGPVVLVEEPVISVQEKIDTLFSATMAKWAAVRQAAKEQAQHVRSAKSMDLSALSVEDNIVVEVLSEDVESEALPVVSTVDVEPLEIDVHEVYLEKVKLASLGLVYSGMVAPIDICCMDRYSCELEPGRLTWKVGKEEYYSKLALWFSRIFGRVGLLVLADSNYVDVVPPDLSWLRTDEIIYSFHPNFHTTLSSWITMQNKLLAHATRFGDGLDPLYQTDGWFAITDEGMDVYVIGPNMKPELHYCPDRDNPELIDLENIGCYAFVPGDRLFLIDKSMNLALCLSKECYAGLKFMSPAVESAFCHLDGVTASLKIPIGYSSGSDESVGWLEGVLSSWYDPGGYGCPCGGVFGCYSVNCGSRGQW
jgi:hypothetical protein